MGFETSSCETRLLRRIPAERFQLFRGDCNALVTDVCSVIPGRALTLAFLDPTGLHLRFDTVRVLAACGAVDLLILFPDSVDILRNHDHLYFDQPESNLDRVLGPDSQWRERMAELGTTDGPALRRFFSTIYREQLQRLAGYEHFAEEVIPGTTGPLYRLVYATKHPRGIDFWNKSVKKELGGQSRLF